MKVVVFLKIAHFTEAPPVVNGRICHVFVNVIV